MGHEVVLEQHDAWVVSPETALKALSAHQGPLIIDLDETLYLRNSTEDFIACAVPGTIGRLLYKALDLVRPWRFSGGRTTRDAWRIRLAAAIPFAMHRWRGRVAEHASCATNEALKTILLNRKDAVIATLGFEPVVRPLLAAMGFGQHRLIACRLGSLSDRRSGKRALVERELGSDAVAQAAVLTDSLDDESLLATCGKPFLVRWPNARFVPAYAGTYVPFEYISRVKRPNLNYVKKSILGDDYMLWLVTSLALATNPVLHTAGLLLLIASFWIIYELGYVDNDRVAERFEEAPVLTQAYRDGSVSVSMTAGWIWALGLGVAGVAMIEGNLTSSGATVFAWIAVLVATFLVYLVYNRVDKATRVWLYSVLQLARACALLAVVPVTAFGAVALAAHASSRWLLYIIYRFTKREWPDLPTNVVRLFLFVGGAIPLATIVELEAKELVTAVAIAGWFTLRAGPRLLAIGLQARWIAGQRIPPK